MIIAFETVDPGHGIALPLGKCEGGLAIILVLLKELKK